MKKIALVTTLVAGFASAAVAEEIQDSFRFNGALYGVQNGVQAQQMIEGRNVYSLTAPDTAEELWFQRASDDTNV